MPSSAIGASEGRETDFLFYKGNLLFIISLLHLLEFSVLLGLHSSL